MPRTPAFQLTKWYLDLVTDRGAAVIAYAATLRLGTLRVRYAALLRADPGAPLRERTALRGVAMPRLEGATLAWHCPRLGAHGTWQRTAPAISAELLRGDAGVITWTCHMSGARAVLDLPDGRLEGLGYAEQLEMSVPPWRLPFRELRWGRHVSPEHAAVWISWSGGADGARRWTWLDGTPQEEAVAGDDGVGPLDGGRTLRLTPGRSLREADVATTLRGPLPAVARRLAAKVGVMREHKQLARSALLSDGTALDQGWTIHEVVRW